MSVKPEDTKSTILSDRPSLGASSAAPFILIQLTFMPLLAKYFLVIPGYLEAIYICSQSSL